MLFWTISGWIIAVFMLGWKIYDTIRLMANITADAFLQAYANEDENAETWIVITNNSQRPINLTEVGFIFKDDHKYNALEIIGVNNIWVYGKKREIIQLKVGNLHHTLKTRRTYITKIYILDESGKYREWPASTAFFILR